MAGDAGVDGVLDAWQADVAAFVTAALPRAPARVLEVGCGDGWLCRHLADLGYGVRGIDPEAPADPLLVPVTLEDFAAPAPFDAVVANLSLHHIADLDGAVDKLAAVLAPGGRLLVVEFAWDRLDDRTARWCLERMPAQLDEHSSLHERLRVLRGRQQRGEPLQARELVRSWAAEHGLHSARAVRVALRRRFVDERFEWCPYLYPELHRSPRTEEAAAIARGDIQPTAFRLVATARS